MLSFSGYGSRESNAGLCFLNGVKGPFTPSQWLELEHQALIYKHFMSNEPIPPNLLFPIRKALESARISSFFGDTIRPNAFGWGAFHLGFSNSTDPEPGRCRRTDGKKWRCTRDAVVDQKYCERHINRGRHRSRKPVEGQTGNSVVSGAATATTTSTTKSVPTVLSSSESVLCGGASDSFNGSNQQPKNWPRDASNSLAPSLVKRRPAGHTPRPLDISQASFPPTDIDLNSRENAFPPPKPRIPCEVLVPYDFGVPATKSVPNASHKTSPFCGGYASPHGLSNRQSEGQNPLWQAIVSRSSTPWVESDKSQHSTSMPMLPLDFMSLTSSQSINKVTISPSQESDLVLGVCSNPDEQNPPRADWVPFSWESSLGGPLGEVLHCTKGSLYDHRDTSCLDLSSKSRDKGPRSSSSSASGILQRNAYGSLSNGSAGSSPRTDHNMTL